MLLYFPTLAALIGLFVSSHIYTKKRTKTKLVCPLRANCDKVIHSTFSSSFGIPNELIGIGYYIVVGGLYSFLLAFPTVADTVFVYYVLFLLTVLGVLFSLYLIALQAVVIKAWCSWCMLSAIANIALGICLLGLPLDQFIYFLGNHKTLWVIVHSIGFVLGVGGATVSDILFFTFLKDFQISENEKNTLETLSNIIWVGLGVLVVSGLMLYLPAQERLALSSKFLVKVVVVGVIVVNGIALNLYVSPRLRQLSFDGAKPATHFRRLAFALGGISITSWYVALILGSLRSIPLSFWFGVSAYGSLLLGVVVGSQIAERLSVRKFHTPHTLDG